MERRQVATGTESNCYKYVKQNVKMYGPGRVLGGTPAVSFYWGSSDSDSFFHCPSMKLSRLVSPCQSWNRGLWMYSKIHFTEFVIIKAMRALG